MILGSTECKNVVGDDMNWPMGLAVALEINLNTLSAAIPLVGNWEAQFLVPSFFSTEALTSQILLRIKVLGFATFGAKIGAENGEIRVLRAGLNSEGNVTVGTVRCVQFMF